MIITKIQFHRFKSIIIVGEITEQDGSKILDIKRTMFFDEYAGYSPNEQKKYAKIKKIASKYEIPSVVTY